MLRRERRRCLDDLPGSSLLYGWVTDDGRPLGIGYHAGSAGRKGERVCRINLPIPISGVQMQQEAARHIRKQDAARRRASFSVVEAA